MKKLYVTAWFLLAGAVLFTVASGAFNAAWLLAFSLIALALVYALALWSVFSGTRDLTSE